MQLFFSFIAMSVCDWMCNKILIADYVIYGMCENSWNFLYRYFTCIIFLVELYILHCLYMFEKNICGHIYIYCLVFIHSQSSYTQGLTLRRARMPRACRSCLMAHKLLWLSVRLGKWFFSLGTYVFSQQYTYISFTELVQILAGYMKIFEGHTNF